MGLLRTYQCAICGVEIRRYPCQIKSELVYCSQKCVGAAKRNGCTLQCEMCDGEFYRRYGEQDIGDKERQFCSRECYQDWRLANGSDDVYRKIGARHIHRIVAEATLGRRLLPREVVHHLDNNKQNNAPLNLAVLPDQGLHSRVHHGKISDDELRKFRLVQE